MILVDILSILKRKFKSQKKSYSFGGVDLLINYFFKDKKKGIYLDIGCQHPISNNNTYLLHKRGWSGINIDLDKGNIDLFNLIRKKDININIAISSKASTKKLFFYHTKSPLNTIEKNTAYMQKAKFKDIKLINTTTLNKILNDLNFKKIDYLNIDVEGHEHDVLKGFDIKKFSPQIISIEYLDFSMKKLEFKNNNLNNVLKSNIYKYMIKNGYTFINWIHADLIFVKNNTRD